MDLADLADSARLNVALAEKLIEVTEETEPDDLKGCLAVLLAAKELKGLASDFYRIVEDMTVAAMGDKRTVALDGHTLEVRRSYRRSDWEHSKLATHVALRALGGEMIEGMDLVVDAFLKACRPEWRVSVLKEMGLSDEDYCARELSRASVAIL